MKILLGPFSLQRKGIGFKVFRGLVGVTGLGEVGDGSRIVKLI
jgi:hypothetical protein